MEKATIIVIGDELLIGQVTDTNSGFIAQQLNKIGIQVQETLTVHDDEQMITEALSLALQQSDIVMMTGGLGPTKDDITKLTLCRFFNTRLVHNEDVRQHVLNLYRNRPAVLNRLTETQWLVPETCTILTNRIGSAPIMLFEHNSADNKRQLIFSMPGVPAEMKVAITEQVIPLLSEQYNKGAVEHFSLVVSGIPESALAIKIEQWEDSLPKNIHLAYLPKNNTITLRLSGTGDDKKSLLEQMNKQWQQLIPLITDYIVTTSDQPLEITIGEILKSKNQTVSTAESCTGGKLAVLLNKHAGSSAFYKGSVVAYSNEVKQHVLGVDADDLNQFGAVSRQVVMQMAQGVKRLLNTDFAVATSGIAGPDGGTTEKPVGTIWIAVATPQNTFSECLHLNGTREQITDTATQLVLVKLLKQIKLQ